MAAKNPGFFSACRVGLVVLHLARTLVGPDFVRLLPVAAPFGGGFLLAIDRLARTATATEIPFADRHAVLHLAPGRHGEDLVVTMLLSSHDLTIGYPDRVVGRRLDVSLATEEVLALLGPNGGGKTTLLKTLLGLLAPQAGEVRLADRVLFEPRTRTPRKPLFRQSGPTGKRWRKLFCTSIQNANQIEQSTHGRAIWPVRSGLPLSVAARLRGTESLSWWRGRVSRLVSTARMHPHMLRHAYGYKPAKVDFFAPVGRPDSGCTLGSPFLTLRTCTLAALKIDIGPAQRTGL